MTLQYIINVLVDQLNFIYKPYENPCHAPKTKKANKTRPETRKNDVMHVELVSAQNQSVRQNTMYSHLSVWSVLLQMADEDLDTLYMICLKNGSLSGIDERRSQGGACESACGK